MRKIMCVCFFIAASSAFPLYAEDNAELYIIDFNYKELYLYDEAGEEVEKLKVKNLKTSKVTATNPATGQDETLDIYFSIEGEIPEEELWQIKYQEKDYWIEKLVAKSWPGNKLDCSDADIVLGQESRSEISGTIGLGQHCK